MKWIDRFSPNSTFFLGKAPGGLAMVRSQILQFFLLGILVVGIWGLSLTITQDLLANGIGLAIFYIAAYLWILVITMWRELPYPIRAGTVIVLCYALAVSKLFGSSLLGEVQFWLLTFTTITSILLGLIPAIISTLLSVLTIVGMGILVDTRVVELSARANFDLGPGWGLSCLALALASAAILTAVFGLVNGLQELLTEREKLAKNLETERSSLETRVQDRTADIQRRLAQVRTSAKISSTISHLSNPATIYQEVVDLVQEELDLYYVGLFLVDGLNRYAELRAATGEPGRLMLTRGHRLPIGGTSMIGVCIATQAPRIALDVGREAVRFNNPLLPLTRSELALPIISRDAIVGALTVQSSKPEAFDENDILVLQGIADSLASAIENARLVSELTQNLDEMRSLNQNYLRDAWSSVVIEQGPVSFSFNALSSQKENLQEIEYPIMLRDQMIAWLTLSSEEARLSPEDEALLEALTTQTALALENARLVQQSERKMIQEQKLNEMSARFSRANDIEGMLKSALEELGRLPQVAEVSVELLPPQYTQQLTADELAAGMNTKGSPKEKTG